MKVETKIKLNRFSPRKYQIPLLDAIENKGYRKVLAVMPRRCLSGNTHITMADGSFKTLKDIVPGDAILSWNGKEFVKDRVKNKWSTGVKKTKVVKSFGYLPLVVSQDHLFAVTGCSQKTYRWKKVSDFSKYDLALNYAGMALGDKHGPDMAEFLGYMLSDGYVAGYQQPKFTNTNQDILRRVEYLAQTLFGYEAIWRPKGNGFDLGFSNGTNGGGTYRNVIKDLFRSNNADVPKSQRRLLSFLWEFDEESLGRFFAAFISGDGNIYCHNKGFVAKDTNNIIPPAIEIIFNCGKSDQFGWDIYWLLRKMGIVPHVPYKERGSNWKIKISKNHCIKKLLSFGPIYGKEPAQQMAFKRIPTSPKTNKITDGCFRSKIKIEDGQEEELYDLETEVNHNFIANGYVVHNSGKDLCCWNLMIRSAISKVGVYFYCLPTFQQARSVIWESITNDGVKFIDYIPTELIEKIRNDTMTITLINGSIIKLIGSDTYDTSLIGTNPRMIVFSEYALSDSRAYMLAARPILNANDGVVLIISTPRGRNSLWELYNIAQNSPDWFCYKLTIEDTNHISVHEIEAEIASGEISRELAEQEYWTSFSRGVEGSYYAKYLDRMKVKGQIGIVPWENGFKVHTCWDLGVRDSTTIIFYQTIGQTIRIIDCYDNSKYGLDHYVNILGQWANEKGYIYGKHIAPHDIKVREFGTGLTRWEKAKQLGITFTIAPDLSIVDGIEAVRTSLGKIWIDQSCTTLLKALENYRQEYDIKKKVYKSHPLHDFASHFADAMRYLCISLPKTKDGSTPEELDKRYREAMYGDNYNMPSIFRDDLPNY